MMGKLAVIETLAQSIYFTSYWKVLVSSAADRWPFRRLQLHHRLLRGQADPPQHHQCNLQENADLSLTSLNSAREWHKSLGAACFYSWIQCSAGIAEDLLITPHQNGILNAQWTKMIKCERSSQVYLKGGTLGLLCFWEQRVCCWVTSSVKCADCCNLHWFVCII